MFRTLLLAFGIPALVLGAVVAVRWGVLVDQFDDFKRLTDVVGFGLTAAAMCTMFLMIYFGSKEAHFLTVWAAITFVALVGLAVYVWWQHGLTMLDVQHDTMRIAGVSLAMLGLTFTVFGLQRNPAPAHVRA